MRLQRVVNFPVLAVHALIVAFCSGASVPLPDICTQVRPDRNSTLDIPLNASNCGTQGKVRRVFFHPTEHCKFFGLCSSVVHYLDTLPAGSINYFQDKSSCKESCTDVVECPADPLQEIENGFPEIPEGRLGFGVSVSFACMEGYRMVENTHRTCQLDGTWSGHQPYCEIQCPRPGPVLNSTISPLQDYYNIGQRVRFDCMDGLVGNSTWTCLANGNWKGIAPTCRPGCIPEVIDNAYPPDLSQNGATITYRCLEGYHLLGNPTLRCSGGELQGHAPICTRVTIVHASGSERVDVSVNNRTVYMIRNSRNVLECGLDGVDEHSYPVQWTVPKKPNGEQRPGVVVNGANLEFSRSFQEQEGTYTCNITGITATVSIVVMTGEGQAPVVTFQDPQGVVKSPIGDTQELDCLTVGSLPLDVTWLHDGSVVVNNSLVNITQYLIRKIPLSNGAYSILTIDGVTEYVQGTYKCVAYNNAGEAESDKVELMLAQSQGQSVGRRRRHTFCSSSDTRKVALVGVVRRTGGLWSGLHTLRVRVDRVLRGTADGISRRSVQVVVSPGTDVSRLWRGQTVLLSGVPSGNRLFTMGSPIEDYTSSLEREIVAC